MTKALGSVTLSQLIEAREEQIQKLTDKLVKKENECLRLKQYEA